MLILIRIWQPHDILKSMTIYDNLMKTQRRYHSKPLDILFQNLKRANLINSGQTRSSPTRVCPRPLGLAAARPSFCWASKFTKLKVVELSKKPETLSESLLGSRSRSVLFAHISLYVIPWRSGRHIFNATPLSQPSSQLRSDIRK